MTPKDKERQERLEALQKEHSKLSSRKKALKSQMGNITEEISKINKELNRLGGQIFDIKNEDGETPHITDHAVVRYLERVKGVDIWALKAEIVAHSDAVRINNVIVTVNEDLEDEDKPDSHKNS